MTPYMKNGNLLDFGPKSFISHIFKICSLFDQYKDYLRNDINEISYSTAISFALQIAKVMYELLVQHTPVPAFSEPK